MDLATFKSLVAGRLAGRVTTGTQVLDTYIANELTAVMYELAAKTWLPPFYNDVIGIELDLIQGGLVNYPSSYIGAFANGVQAPGVYIDRLIGFSDHRPLSWNPDLTGDIYLQSDPDWVDLEPIDAAEAEHFMGSDLANASAAPRFYVAKGLNIQLYPKNSLQGGLLAVPVKFWGGINTNFMPSAYTAPLSGDVAVTNPWFSLAPMMLVNMVAARIAALYLKDPQQAQILNDQAERMWDDARKKDIDQEAGTYLSTQPRMKRFSSDER